MFQQAKQATTKFIGDVQQYGDTVLNGRNDVPPKVRQIVKDFKDVPIVSIIINRTPVNSMIIGALNVVSQGHFGKKMDQSPYDKLYHLRIDCKMQNGKTVKLEKNEVINADVNPSTVKGAETKPLNNMKQGITLKGILQGGERVMGSKFIPYDAVHNNCQDFILGLLRGSNIGDQSDIDFIKQDTKGFFTGKDQKTTRSVAKFVTDLGGKVNQIMTGHGLEGQQVQSILFDCKLFTLPECKIWLKKHGYKSIVDTKPDHYRFRQISPKLLTDYKTKKIAKGIEFILGIPKIHGGSIDSKSFKNKICNDINMSDSEGDYSSNDDTMGSGLAQAQESDIMNRMAHISHDIHQHQLGYGLKSRIVKGYQLLGQGLKESGFGQNQTPEGGKWGYGVNHRKKFNNWFKSIGSKFKTLNHNLQPIKAAGTTAAVGYIQAKTDPVGSTLNEFQQELPQTIQALKGHTQVNPTQYTADLRHKNDQAHQSSGYSQPQYAQQSYSYPYSGYSQPQYGGYQPDYSYQPDSSYSVSQPYVSPFADSYSTYANHMYGSGIGRNVVKTSKSAAKDLITAGSDRAVRSIAGSNVIKTSKSAAKKLITASSDRIVRAIAGSNVIATSKGAAKDLITAGSDRGVRAIEGSGAKRGRLVKGSPEAKEWARKMREARMHK
jgi:hypothetical protein